MGLIRVTDLHELTEESKAFLLYYVSQDLTNIAENLSFKPCDTPFGKYIIKYETTFINDLEGLVEYWIVFNDDKALGVAQRISYDANFESSFLHFKLNREDEAQILSQIPLLPQVYINEEE